MAQLTYREIQQYAARTRAAFGGLSATEAAKLCLGWRPLTPAQEKIMVEVREDLDLLYQGVPCGHLLVVPASYLGCDGRYGRVILRPLTDECRAEVDRLTAAVRGRDCRHLRRRIEDRLRKMGPLAGPLLAELENRLGL